MLIVFSGGSGVGKNTVIERLLESDEFSLMPTYTTRDRRPNEREGYPYHFISEEVFLEKLRSGELYEHQLVHEHYYGTSKVLMAESLATGKILLKDIDVIGTQNLVNSVGKSVKMITLFLKVNSRLVLEQRLKERGEKEIELRLKRYDMEQAYADNYDYIINNEMLDKTLGIVKTIIENERMGRLPLAAVKSPVIDKNLVEEYVQKLNSFKKLQPMPVSVVGGRIVVVDQYEKYLAQMISGQRVSKEVVDFTGGATFEFDWKNQ